MRVLILDNYDSFTYNLYHYTEQFCSDVTVRKTDAIGLNEVSQYSHILISPGPGLPKDAGVTMQVIETYAQQKSILGVCLGFQAIALWAGAELYNQPKVAHGLSRDAIRKNASWLLENVPSTFKVGLYHSWAVDLTQAKDFYATAQLSNGALMAFEHATLPLAGVQFHPESIMTEGGLKILKNWIKR